MQIRAMNKVQFGGPMALAVCHGLPYTIDTTPPFVNDVNPVVYDEDTFLITAAVNAR